MADYIYPKVKFEATSQQEEFYINFLKKYFSLQELFNQKLIDTYGEKCLQFVELDILKTIYFIRVYYNEPMRINDYSLGLSNRLVRFPDCSDYRPCSMHSVIIDSKGRITKRSGAVDFDIIGHVVKSTVDGKTKKVTVGAKTADEVRRDIMAHPDLTPFAKINRLEGDINWVHADISKLPSGIKRIHLFKV